MCAIVGRNRQGLVQHTMHAAPLAGVGAQRRGGLEVAAAEGLQRVLGGAAGHGLVAPGGGDVVAQLRHQHRGRLVAVVAHAAARPAHIQHAPRRQQGFEHELAVVVLARAVAGAEHAALVHQVEVAARCAAGVVAIVHAQQAHHLERDGAHGHQRAKGHATRPEALVEAGLLQGVHPAVAQRGQRHGLCKPGLFAGAQPARQAVVECGQGLGIGLIGAAQQRAQQPLGVVAPLLGRGLLLAALPPTIECVQQVGQAARHGGIQATHFGVRLYALPACGGSGRIVQRPGGIGQQHALQPKPGAVLLATFRQAQLRALLGVQPPADARTAHPLRELRQLVGGDAKAPGNGGHFQQIHQLAQAAALRGQAQQPFQCHDDRAAGLGAQISNIEGDKARIVARVLAEHGANGRGHALYVGHHDDDVARGQTGLGQQGQQLVLQHLQLAHRAVRHMEHHGAVVTRQRCIVVAHRQRLQVADTLLHAGEQGRVCRFGGLAKQVDFEQRKALCCGGGIVKGIKLAHKVAPLAAPGGQQRVGVQMHVFPGGRRTGAACARVVAAALHPEQLAAFDDVAPVKAAGVGHGQNHLAVRRQRGQQLQVGARDVAHAKHHQAARHPARKVLVALQARQRLAVQVGAGGAALLGRQALQHRAPQCRLPALVVRQGLGLASGGGDGVVPGGPGL